MSMISWWKVRGRIAGQLLCRPLVGLPLMLGVAACGIGAWLGDGGGTLTTLGSFGILAGFAAAIANWVRHGSQLRRRAVAGYRVAASRGHDQYLAELDRRLRNDDDDRTNQLLSSLGLINRRMRRIGIFAGDLPKQILPEVREKTLELYQSCLSSLERSAELRAAALEMATGNACHELIRTRESLLDEVRTSVRHLDATLDYLQTSKLKHLDDEPIDAERTWDDLEIGLQVARRVEERMNELETAITADRINET